MKESHKFVVKISDSQESQGGDPELGADLSYEVKFKGDNQGATIRNVDLTLYAVGGSEQHAMQIVGGSGVDRASLNPLEREADVQGATATECPPAASPNSGTSTKSKWRWRKKPLLLKEDGSAASGVLKKLTSKLAKAKTVEDIFAKATASGPGRVLLQEFADVLLRQVDKNASATLDESGVKFVVKKQDPDNPKNKAYSVKFFSKVKTSTDENIVISISYIIDKEAGQGGSEQQYVIKDAVLRLGREDLERNLPSEVKLPEVRSSSIRGLWEHADKRCVRPVLWNSDGTLEQKVCFRLKEVLSKSKAIETIFKTAQAANKKGSLIQAFSRVLLAQVGLSANPDIISGELSSKILQDAKNSNLYFVALSGAVTSAHYGKIRVSVAYDVAREAKKGGYQYAIKDAKLFLTNGDFPTNGDEEKGLWTKIFLPEVTSPELSSVWKYASENCTKTSAAPKSEAVGLWEKNGCLKKEYLSKLAAALENKQQVQAVFEESQYAQDPHVFVILGLAEMFLSQVDKNINVTTSGEVNSHIGRQDQEGKEAYSVKLEGVVRAGSYGEIRATVRYNIAKGERKPDGSVQHTIDKATLCIAQEKAGEKLWTQVELPSVQHSSSILHLWEKATRDRTEPQPEASVAESEEATVIEPKKATVAKLPEEATIMAPKKTAVAKLAEEQQLPKKETKKLLWGQNNAATLESEILAKLASALDNPQQVKSIFEKANDKKDPGESLIQAFVRVLLDQVDENAGVTIDKKIESKFESHPSIEDAFVANIGGVVDAGDHGKIKASVTYVIVKETGDDGSEKYVIKDAELSLANGNSKGNLQSKITLPSLIQPSSADNLWKIAKGGCNKPKQSHGASVPPEPQSQVVAAEPEKQLQQAKSLWGNNGVLKKDICDKLTKALAGDGVVRSIFEQAKDKEDLGKFLIQEFAKVFLKQIDEKDSARISKEVESKFGPHPDRKNAYLVDFESGFKAGSHSRIRISVVYTVAKEKQSDGKEQYVVDNAALYIGKAGEDLWAKIVLPEVQSSDNIAHIWEGANQGLSTQQAQESAPTAKSDDDDQAVVQKDGFTKQPTSTSVSSDSQSPVVETAEVEEQSSGESKLWGTDGTLKDEILEKLTQALAGDGVVRSIFEQAEKGKGLGKSLIQAFVRVLLDQVDKEASATISQKIASTFEQQPGVTDGDNAYTVDFESVVGAGALGKIKASVVYVVAKETGDDGSEKYAIKDAELYLANGDSQGEPLWAKVEFPEVQSDKIAHIWEGANQGLSTQQAQESAPAARSDDDDQGVSPKETTQCASDEQIRVMIRGVSQYYNNENPSDAFDLDKRTEEALIEKYKGQLTVAQTNTPPIHIINAIIDEGKRAAKDQKESQKATGEQIRDMIRRWKKIYDEQNSPGLSFDLNHTTENALVAKYSGQLTVGQTIGSLPLSQDVTLEIFTSIEQSPATTQQIKVIIQRLKVDFEREYSGFSLDSEAESRLVVQYSGTLKVFQVINLESVPQYVKDAVLKAGGVTVEAAAAKTPSQAPGVVNDRRGIATQPAMAGTTEPEVHTPGWNGFVNALTSVVRVYDTDGNVQGASNLLKLVQLGAVTGFGPAKSGSISDDQKKRENELDQALEKLRRIANCPPDDDSKCTAVLHATVNTLQVSEEGLQKLIGSGQGKIVDQKLHLRWLSGSDSGGVRVERHFLLESKDSKKVQLTATYDVKSSGEDPQVVVGVSNFVLSSIAREQSYNALIGTGTVEWGHDDPKSTKLYVIKGGQNTPLRDVMHANTLLNLAVNESLKKHGGAGKLLLYPQLRTVDRNISPELLSEFTENVHADAQPGGTQPALLSASPSLQQHVTELSAYSVPQEFIDQMCSSMGVELQECKKLSTLSFPVSAIQQVNSTGGLVQGIRLQEVYSLSVREPGNEPRPLSLYLTYDLLEYRGQSGQSMTVLCNFEVTIREKEESFGEEETPDAKGTRGPLYAVSRHPEVLIPLRIIGGQPTQSVEASSGQPYNVQDGGSRTKGHALPVPQQIDAKEEIAQEVQLWSSEGTFNFITEFEKALCKDVCLKAFFGWDSEDEYEFHENLVLRLIQAGFAEFLSEDVVADFKVEEDDTKLSVDRGAEENSYRVTISTVVAVNNEEKIRVKVCYNIKRTNDQYTVTNLSLSVGQEQGNKWSQLSVKAAEGLVSEVDAPFRNAKKVYQDETAVSEKEAAEPEMEVEIESVDGAEEEVEVDDEALPEVLSLSDVWPDFVKGIKTVLGDETLFAQLFRASSVPGNEAGFGESLALRVVKSSIQKLKPGARVWIDQGGVTSRANMIVDRSGMRNYACHHKIVINSDCCESVHATLNYTVRDVVPADGVMTKGGCVITNASISVRSHIPERDGTARHTTVSIPDMIYEGSNVPLVEAQQVYARGKMPAAATASGAGKEKPGDSWWIRLFRSCLSGIKAFLMDILGKQLLCGPWWVRLFRSCLSGIKAFLVGIIDGVTGAEPQKPKRQAKAGSTRDESPEVMRTNQGKGRPGPQVRQQNDMSPATALNPANAASVKVRGGKTGVSNSSRGAHKRAP
ncbi:MAG: hypothetical protein ACTJLL_01915 [Anaplasma sp.]